MKKYINISKMASVFVLTLLLSTGCEKDFLDINNDPNNPLSVPTNQLLTSSQVNLGFTFGNDPSGLNGYAAIIMHQFLNRGNLNDYGLVGGDFQVVVSWTSLYAGALTDLNVIIEQGTADGDLGAVGIAQVMKAFIMSTIVDVWGDVPYFDANKGALNLEPAYDGGAAVYADLFTLIDSGIANLTTETKSITGDLFYGGNASSWITLANSLKLRMYNNVRLVQNVSTEVNALITNGNLISSSAQDFELTYGTSLAPENRNPGYVQEWSPGGSFNYIDPYFYEVMRSQDTFNHGGLQFGVQDPRLPYYFFNQLPAGSADGDAENPVAYGPSSSGSSFLSIYAYSFNIDPNEGFDQSSSQTVAGLYPLGGRYDDGAGGIAANSASLLAGQVSGNPTVPQRLLTSAEVLYIRAELAHQGVTTEDARAMFNNAMTASFAKVDKLATDVGSPAMTAADVTAYITAVLALYDAANPAGQLELIITQKWIASFGNSLMSYNDQRRTGYPRLHDGNTDNLNVTVQTRSFPVSFPYPTNNLSLNPKAPSQRVIATDRVFWDN